MFDINNLASIKVGLASPEKIREWSHDSEHSLDDDNAEYRNEESLMTEDGSEYRNDRRPNRGPANNYSANMGNNRQDMDSQSIVNDIIQDSKTNE